MENKNPKVDIIIPTYKPDGKYDKLIERLGRQSLQANHIYVINTITEGADKPQDENKPKLANLSITHIPKSEFNHGGTRNMGVKMSDADFVMMMTQDAVPADTRLLEQIMEPFADPKVAAVYARQLPTKEVGIIEGYTRQFNYPEESSIKSKDDLEQLGIKTFFCSDVCAVYRKSVYDELGGFVTQTIFNEDMILASKIIDAGYSIAYAADAKVYHAHKYTYRQQFTRNFDLGVSQRQYRQVFEGVKSESEGIKMVKQTAGYLLKEGHPFLIIDLVLQSGFKFLGYRLGKRYDKLPLWIIRACSMQKSYWENGKG